MKNKEIKKIQLGSYCKRHFSEIRNKVGILVMKDELEVPERHFKKGRKNKKNWCRRLNGPHSYARIEKPMGIGTHTFKIDRCSGCRRQEYVWEHLRK